MSTSVASVVSHFPSAQNGFTTTLASTISSGATTVPLNSVAGYTNGQTAVFVIDPSDATKKQTFTGVINTGGIQVTSVVWTAGTNQSHSGGATVVDYATATHISMMTKGLLVAHDQTGVHKSGATYAAPVFSGTATGTYTLGGTPTITTPTLQTRFDGWTTTALTPNTVTASGNQNYSVVFNSVDLTGYISNGMRLKMTRTVTAPAQCTDLESGSSQYFNKTSPAAMTFTDDFTVSAWVRLESYNGAIQTIASRYDGTSGWVFELSSSGVPFLVGRNAGAANASYVQAYESLPLGKWVHVAAQLDMSTFTATTTTSYIMIDGVNVSAVVARGGTNPTALVQAGNLEIGAQNGGTLPFDGKLAQVAIYNAKVTQATILASMNQALSGSETSLISAYSFSNSINDLSANANNLTAQGSALATNVDSPFAGGSGASSAYTAGTTEYGEVFNISFSTNTTIVVQVPEGYAIPTSGGVSALAYSVSERPLGFPKLNSVIGYAMVRNDQTSNSNGSNVDINGLVTTFYCPPDRAVRVTADIVSSTAVAATLTSVMIYEGSTDLTGKAYQEQTSGIRGQIIADNVIYPTAGFHTYKVVFYTNQNGNTTVFGNPAVTGGPSLLIVELI